MKFIEKGTEGAYNDIHLLELTERNLRTLLAKLDETNSSCTLIDGRVKIMVKAVPDEAHYADRRPGPVLINGEII